MIVLDTTSKLLRVVTSAAVAVDVNVDFFDSDTVAVPATFAPGNAQTAISTATTTTITAAPSGNVKREIKHLTMCARGGFTNVRPELFNGTTAFQCVGGASGIPLLQGETLEYVDTAGWRVVDPNGAVKQITTATIAGHVIKDNGTARPQRANANTVSSATILFTATDDGGADETEFSCRVQGNGTDNTGGAAITLGDGTVFNLITSTTTITSFVFTNDFAGRTAEIVFQTARTLTHNSTSLILPGATNIRTVAGDTCLLVSLGGGNFRVTRYTKATGAPVGLVKTAITASSSQITNATTNIDIVTFTIPANSLIVGSVWRLTGLMAFVHTAATTPTLTVALVVNAVEVLTTVMTPPATALTYGVRAEAIFTIRSIGGGGTMNSWVGLNMSGEAAGTSQFNSQDNATTTIDTTVTRAIILRARMTTAVASNSLRANQGFIERLD